jgi:hypothetical protein
MVLPHLDLAESEMVRIRSDGVRKVRIIAFILVLRQWGAGRALPPE